MQQYRQRDVYIPSVGVQTKKDYVPRLLHASSSQNPRYFHASCVRSTPFHASSRSFHVQETNPCSGKNLYLPKHEDNAFHASL